jgi:hypothetical protein
MIDLFRDGRMRRDRQLEAVTPRTVIRFCGVFKVVIGGTRGMKPVVPAGSSSPIQPASAASRRFMEYFYPPK